MSATIDSLQTVFDRAFTTIGQVQSGFAAHLAPREIGTVIDVSTGIARVSGLPNVGFEELTRISRRGLWDRIQSR